MQDKVLARSESAPINSSDITLLTFNRFMTENILIMLLQYMGLSLTTLSDHPTLIWPASGAACAFAFLRGYSILPGLFLGSFLAYFFGHALLFISWQCAILLTIQTASLLFFSYRYVSPMLFYYSPYRFLSFVSICSIVTLAMSFFMILICRKQLPHLSFQIDGLIWWLANLNGILLFAFGIVAWDLAFPDIHALTRQTIVKMSFIVITISLIAALMFFVSSIKMFCFLAMLLAMIHMITSIYFGWLGSVTVLFFLGIVIFLSSAIGVIPSFQHFIVLYEGLIAAMSMVCLFISIHFYKKIA
jgi:hypothetical protein